jgi:hypothetical protein
MDQFRNTQLHATKPSLSRPAKVAINQIDQAVAVVEGLCDPDEMLSISAFLRALASDLAAAAVNVPRHLS